MPNGNWSRASCWRTYPAALLSDGAHRVHASGARWRFGNLCRSSGHDCLRVVYGDDQRPASRPHGRYDRARRRDRRSLLPDRDYRLDGQLGCCVQKVIWFGKETFIRNMMLKIRDEQMKVFEEVALWSYEDEMVQHLKEFTPRHSEIIGEQAVRQVVRMGIDRGKEYGLTNRGPVRFYIELMFMLGSDFDTDPQYPWAEEILTNSEITDQMQRADRLYEKAKDFIDKVSGPNHKYEEEAIRRFSQMRFEDFSMSKNEIVMHLKRIYPQKCEYIGEQAMNALLREGITSQINNAISTDSGLALFVGLMFVFGHGCFTDSQFPWIGATLNNTAFAESNKRIERLYSKMMTYFSNALVLMEKR